MNKSNPLVKDWLTSFKSDSDTQTAKEDFQAYIKYAFRDPKGQVLVPQSFHTKIYEALSATKIGPNGEEVPKYPKCLIKIFRGSGKSTTVTIGWSTFTLGRKRDSRIIIGSKVIDQSKEWLRQIDTRLQSDKYQNLFGNLVPPQRVPPYIWTQTSKVVLGRSEHATHLSLMALAVGGTAVGRRADLIILDDILDAENSSTPIQRQHVQDWFWTEIWPILEPISGQIIICGTPWAKGDLYDTLEEEWKDDPDAFVLKVPAIEKIGEDEKGKTIWQSVWPERFLTETLLDLREKKPLEFSSQYLVDPIDLEHAPLKREWLKTRVPPSMDSLIIHQGVDPNLRQQDGSDYTVIVTIGVDYSNSKVYILDCSRSRQDLDGKVKMIIAQANQWNPSSITIESNAAQILLVEQLQRETLLPVRDSITKGAKAERFTAMSQYFTTERAFLAGELDDNGLMHTYSNLDPLIEEWTYFPRGEHDDTLDALEKALEGARLGGQAEGITANPRLETPERTTILPYHRQQSQISNYLGRRWMRKGL